MVLTSIPAAGPSKGAPQTTLSNDWDTTPAMLANFQPSPQLPYAHYALIYMDNTGKLRVQESQSIREQNDTVFSPEVQQRFLEILGPKIGYHRPMALRQHRENVSHPSPASRRVKRRRNDSWACTPSDSFSGHVEEIQPYPLVDMIELEIGDTEKVIAYYEAALKRFQQINCRNIAKAFIKVIEPRKQVRHPYNKGDKTKPDWWPSNIIHKEPDHLRTEFRIPLLMHILRNLGDYGVTADKLKEVAHDSKKTLQQGGIEILDEVFRVRKLEERFERGEVDANTKVYVFNYNSSNSKRRRVSRTSSAPNLRSRPKPADDASSTGIMTPSSSVGQGQLASPIGNIAVGTQSEANQFFQISDSLGFEGQARQDHRPYYPASTEYPEFPSHDVLKTPVTSAGGLNQNEQPGFNYLTQAPFPTPGSEAPISPHHRHPPLPMHSSPDHFHGWNLRQNMFGSVDFGATSGNPAIPQPHIPFQVPVPGPTEQAHMAHGFPQMGPITTIKAPPFRTGSLSHPHIVPPPLHTESLRLGSTAAPSEERES